MAAPQLSRLSGPVGQLVRHKRRELVAAAAAHDVKNLRVFGSVARGEDRADSDVDLLADLPPGMGLLVAPFGYDGEASDHWYAWDIASCWILTAVGAGVFGSAQDALAEWQRAVGPPAGTALSPSAPELTPRGSR